MKSAVKKLISIFFLTVILLTFPQFILAQEKLLGELSFENNPTATGEQFVTVNNEKISSGRSIMSPATITTAQTTAKISLARTGFIKIAPVSKMNLYFENAGISGDFLQGNITVDALPFTKFNILTADGAITASNLNNENVFVASLVNNKTQIKVLSGEVLFNGVLVTAGQTYPSQITAAEPQKVATSGGSNNTIFIVLGAAAAVAVIAALTLSGGNDNNSVVSPVR